MRNLTREAAARRAELLDVDAYDIHLDVTGEEGFTSRTTVTFRCREPGASTVVDIVADEVRGAGLDGVALDVSGYDPEHGLDLRGLAEHNVLVVDAVCRYSRTGEGLHRYADPVDGEVYLYSMLCVAAAQRMYACFDQPDLKAEFTFHVTAPPGWRVVSNDVVEALEKHASGAVTTHFAETPPLPTYVTAVVAGPYERRSAQHDGIDLDVYCRRSLVASLDEDEIFEVTKAGLDFYHRVFGVRYPYIKYDQVFVPEFNPDAMENAGCVTFSDDLLFQSRVTDSEHEWRASIVLHELAHMWFGDLVTARWWDDLWLNESFATFLAALAQAEATRWTGAWTTFANGWKAWAYEQDQLSSSHPVVADIPDVRAVEVNFDGVTYAKGASVLRQLVAYVGQDQFLAALPIYLRRHAHTNAIFDDLVAVLTEVSGRDLSAWSTQWLRTAQVNTVSAACGLDAEGGIRSFALHQSAPADHPCLRTHRLALGLYERTDGELQRTGRIELDVAGERTDVQALLGRHLPDLVLVNDDDLTYAKVRLDDRSLATALAGIASIADPLARAVCWSMAWDMTRDAELPAREFVALVLGGVGSEPDAGVMQNLLKRVHTTLSFYAYPAWSWTGWRELAQASWEGMHAAPPGSDRQLVWARTLAGAAHDTTAVARLRALYWGTELVDGLELDLELRWSLLGGLVAAGQAGRVEIDAELAKERNAIAEQRAATALALRPDTRSKANAWQRAIADERLPHVITRAVTKGFWHPAQTDSLAFFVERYFSDIGPAWQRRSNIVAETLASGLFPAVASEATVQAANAWLARDDAPTSLHRLVAEGRDRIVRALRCRARDQAAATG